MVRKFNFSIFFKRLIILATYYAFIVSITTLHTEARELSKFEIKRIQKILNHYGHEVAVTGVFDPETSSAAKKLISEKFPDREGDIRVLYELNTKFMQPQENNGYPLYSLKPTSGSRGAIDYNKVQKWHEKARRYLKSPAIVFATNGYIGRGNTVLEATKDACSGNLGRPCKASHVLAPPYSGCIAHYRFSPSYLSLTQTKSTNYGVIVHRGAKVIITKKKPTIEEAKKEVCDGLRTYGCARLELSCNF